MDPAVVTLLGSGALLVCGGVGVLVWLAQHHWAVAPAQRRAEGAEEALARLRAQSRQHRMPEPLAAAAVLADADRVLTEEAPRVWAASTWKGWS